MNFFNLTTSCVNYYIINDLQYLVKGEDMCACGYVCGVKNRDFRFLCLVSNSSSPKRKQLNILISKTLGKKMQITYSHSNNLKTKSILLAS